MNNFQTLDAKPAPAIETRSSGPKYITDEAVGFCMQNPGKFVLLGDGHLVDKAYFPSLELQAYKTQVGLRVEFVLQKKEMNTDTTSGKPSYSYKGHVYGCFEAPQAVDEAVYAPEWNAAAAEVEKADAEKDEKKAKKKAKKMAMAKAAAEAAASVPVEAAA